ncbi:MAG TPA: ankyrin repeat domain-containing protein [Bryobacteraceae bacterium]|jgi:ankyrin repeat protein
MNAWDQLVEAAQKGDLAAMESALANGALINGAPAPIYNREISAYTGNVTALMEAAMRDQPAAIEFLLDRGAAIDQRDGEGMGALHYAISCKNPRAMRTLVERGASLQLNSMGGAPIELACRFLGAKDVGYLLDHGVNANGSFYEGRTPLVATAEQNRPDLVEVLLKHGADPKRADSRGRTPFSIATRNRSSDLIRALEDPAEPDPQRALYNCAHSGNVAVISAAIARGAKIDGIAKPDKSGGDATALMYASMSGAIAAAALLLDLGADVNFQSEFGVTAVHCAIANDHLNLVKLLVERGRASLRIEAYYDGPPLNLATHHGTPEMIRYLVEHGAPVNTVQKWGNTALADAVLHGHIENARVLLELGADRKRKGPDGRSALEMFEQVQSKDPAWRALFER